MELDAETTALILIGVQRGVLAMPLAPHSAAAVYERLRRTTGAPFQRSAI